jgi:signal peptidase II
LVDQISKWWILLGYMTPAQVIEVTFFFNLVAAWNTGVSFSLLAGGPSWIRWMLIVLSLVVVAAVLWWIKHLPGWFERACAGLLVGGALGNVIDRLYFGAVFDFLDFHVAGWHWPAFNAADSFIVVGAFGLAAVQLFTPEPRPVDRS